MASLVFPVLPDGLLVDVLIGLDGASTQALHTAGLPIPPPIRARGEIDTGSNLTAVSAPILQRLGVPLQYQTTTQTASGQSLVNMFAVSVGVRDLGNPTAPGPVEPTLLVMELTTVLTTVEVLIGLDFLLGCRLLLDGPLRQFVLEF